MKQRIAVLCLLGTLFLQCLFSMKETSATFDETAHVGAAYAYVTTGQFNINPEHPPLSKLLSGLPLLALGLPSPYLLKNLDDTNGYRFGEELLFASGADADKVLFWARLPMVLLSLFLALLVYAFSRGLFGPHAGLLALFLYCFSPALIAHSSLVSADIGVSLGIGIFLYCLWRFVTTPSYRHLALAGVGLGISLLMKHNALYLVPLFPLILLRYRQRLTQNKFGIPRCILIMLCLALLVIWLGYGLQMRPLLFHDQPHPELRKAWETLTLSQRQFILKVGRIPTPWSGYLRGLRWRLFDTLHGKDSFVLGIHSPRPLWYSNLLAFMVKSPLSFLVMLGGAVFGWPRQKRGPYQDSLWLVFLPALWLLGSEILFKTNGLLRYALPVYPLLIIFASQVTGFVFFSKRPGKILLSLLCLWQAGACLYISPDYLAYFNELVGGPDKGHLVLVDSNLDWGQGLKRLKTYMDQKGIREIKLSYFGTASPAYYGIKVQPLLPSTPAQGWVAISATHLMGVHTPGPQSFAWLQKYTPVAKIGYSIFVYNLDSPRQGSTS